MAKQKLTFLILLLFCFCGSIVSLFFPYLEKLNVRGGDLDLPTILYGYSFQTTSFALLFNVILILILVTTKNTFLPFMFSFLSLGFVYITRILIHFQGFIDHDFDSKTGMGYHLLVIFSFAQFSLVLIYLLIKKKT